MNSTDLPNTAGGRPRWLWRLVRLLMKWRYGVRGALRPPIRHGICSFCDTQKQPGPLYRWRFFCWRIEARIYERTGLPHEWVRWMNKA